MINRLLAMPQKCDVPRDVLTREILKVILDEGKPIRNREIVQKIFDKSRMDSQFKKILNMPSKATLRVQVTVRLQRLIKDNILEKETKSAKNVVYWIKNTGLAKEQVEKEVFRQSLSGQKFQKVLIKTEEIVEKHRKELNEKIEKRLLSFFDKWNLKRNPARKAIYKALGDELMRMYDKSSKVYIVYPTNSPQPKIGEKEIADFYTTFLEKCSVRDLELGKEATSISVVFHYDRLPPDADEKYQEKIRNLWYEVMNLDPNAPPPPNIVEIQKKFNEDYRKAVELMKKTYFGMLRDIKLAKRKGYIE
jgi:hypothetical protein